MTPQDRRFDLKRAAARLVPEQRVSKCYRLPVQEIVSLIKHPASGKCSWSGLSTCSSVWACPVCASKITERRRVELADAIERWQAQGGSCVMVTFTVRHHSKQALVEVLNGLKEARNRMLSGKGRQVFDRRWMIAGRIKALEVTHGENGWHPHLHEIWFLEAGANLEGMITAVKARWEGAVVRSGLATVNDHGCRVQIADMGAAEYVAKYGYEKELESDWTLAHELAKANQKVGRLDNRTPTGLLAAYAWEGDDEAGRLWAEYARAFKGSHQLHWSQGLRELLGMGREKTDAEVNAEETASGEVVLGVTRKEWKKIYKQKLEAVLLQIGAEEEPETLAAFLVAVQVWKPDRGSVTCRRPS